MPLPDPIAPIQYGTQPTPAGMGQEAPDFGGDTFEYRPAYDYAQAYQPQDMTAQMNPIMREVDRRQNLMADDFKAGQTMRGIRNSTPGFNAAMDFGGALNDQRSNIYTSASNALSGQNRADQAQNYNQQMGGRAQNFGEFNSMMGSQNQNDAQRQATAQQAIQGLMQALGINVGASGSPSFNAAEGSPSFIESLARMFGNSGGSPWNMFGG